MTTNKTDYQIEDLIYRLSKRAEIQKSVQDRDLLEESARCLQQLYKEKWQLSEDNQELYIENTALKDENTHLMRVSIELKK